MSIRHIVHTYKPKSNDRDRLARAEMTWENPVKVPLLPRCGKRGTPYVLDVIDFGIAGLSDEDFFFITNTDSHLVREAYSIISDTFQVSEMMFSGRRNHSRALRKQIDIRKNLQGDSYNGHDLFGFKVSAFKRIRGSLPDLLLGFEGWDWVFKNTILKSGGIKIFPEIVAHEHHGIPYWYRNREVDADNLYNRKLCAEWALQNKDMDFSDWPAIERMIEDAKD